jgi:hypothetical protein
MLIDVRQRSIYDKSMNDQVRDALHSLIIRLPSHQYAVSINVVSFTLNTSLHIMSCLICNDILRGTLSLAVLFRGSFLPAEYPQRSLKDVL